MFQLYTVICMDCIAILVFVDMKYYTNMATVVLVTVTTTSLAKYSAAHYSGLIQNYYE